MSAVPYLSDSDFTLYNGDALEVLRELPAESVQMCVTSPPYWGLRDYGTGTWEGGDAECDHAPPKQQKRTFKDGPGVDGNSCLSWTERDGSTYRETCPKCGARRVDNQLGLEPTPELYIERMVEVFREVKRVLRADGTCWLNIGDSYNAHPCSPSTGGFQGAQRRKDPGYEDAGRSYSAGHGLSKTKTLKPKDLCMIPARLALALQADGWYLRSQIVWSKPNPMPESVSDRPTSAYELVYLLAKQPRYYFDAEAVREPHSESTFKMNPRYGTPDNIKATRATPDLVDSREVPDGAAGNWNERWLNPAGRNLRNVWTIATEPFPEAHFATFPQALVERCIKAGTSEALVGLMEGLYVDIEEGDLHGKDDWIPRWVKAVDALAASPGKGAEGKTHGRSCGCTPCRAEDWDAIDRGLGRDPEAAPIEDEEPADE